MSKAAKSIAKVISGTVGGQLFGLGGNTGSENDSAPAVAAPAATPTAAGEEASAAREAQRRRQLAAAGLGGNILTGAGGLSNGATTAGKSLLGS